MEQTVQVYRIEWPDGVGFYSGGGYHLMDDTNDYDVHPGPVSDSLYAQNQALYCIENPDIGMDRHYFGFQDVAQLRRWFYNDSWLQNMQREGLLIKVYTVPARHVVYGRAQVTFLMEEAKLAFTMQPMEV